MLRLVLLCCLALSALAAGTRCPDGGACGEGTACCRTRPGSKYGCCPLAQGSLPMVRASNGNGRNDTVCAEGSRCPSEYSCLKSRGLYECCPLPQGVSCSDGKHCCPEHHQCGEDGHTCVWAKDLVGAVICPDGESECPVETTCCQLPDSSWGCCPMAKAVCCEDREHCCPEGSTCDLIHSKCQSPTRRDTPMWAKLPARRRAGWEDRPVVRPLGETAEAKDQSTVGDTSISCPDGRLCPDQATCCHLNSGSYSCCPYPNAVCCSDQLHCCPSGTTCDMVHMVCQAADSQTPLAEKIPASSDVGYVFCDCSHACPDGSTCCKTDGGIWGCCPVPEAGCCDDHIHCCPKGTTCNLAAGTCDHSTVSVPWLEKVPVLSRMHQGTKMRGVMPWLEKVPALTHRPNKEGNVLCDASHACPDGSTCCKTDGGVWSCCPLPEAVCCDDHVHCCPKDTTCNLAAGTCDLSTVSVPWLEKVPALTHRPNKEGNVLCDASHACPDGSTCCKTDGGVWSCCPLPEAVGCVDHVHCCPKDTTCNLAAGTCDHSTVSVPWLVKVPALTHRPNKEGDVLCDASHACPDGSTCCKTDGGVWSCCPLPEAVCCDDHVHCCPKDTTCNLAAGTCDLSTVSVPWLEKVPALTHHPNKEEDVFCDASHACPDGSTCCKTDGGVWSCCPLPEAVCCDDHVHCCPKDTTCNLAAGTCDDTTVSVPWLVKVPALTHRPNKEGDVLCDASHACPDGSTCCKTDGGVWSCCPLPEAVCCDDHVHCCPKDTFCNLAAGTCDDTTVSVPWLEKAPALSRMHQGAKMRGPWNAKTQALARPSLPRDVWCDSQSSCPEGSTCCRLSTGQWGCCPLDKAVCCDDGKHCCPRGYTCGTTAGSCSRSGEPRWDAWTALFRGRL